MNSIVIGSGFGGIAAALRLKAKGHKVTLIEKHPDLGGRARVFKRNGFTYDGGPTVITAPYLITPVLISGCPNCADSAAKIMSHIIATSHPPPSA